MVDFTLGARRRSPDSHRPRAKSRAGHLDDPGVGAQFNVIPLRRRVAAEGLVHGGPRQGGEVVGKGQDGHRVPLVQEDGAEDDVAEEATEVCTT